MAIKECTPERYNQMLEVLPPEVWLGKGFLVGEPTTHRRCKITSFILPSYAAFFSAYRRYYEGDDMTIPEFKAFDIKDLPLPKDFPK
jgi:hypothetical protein